MTVDESKLEILKKVESGTLSIEEGADLLAILDGGSRQGSSAPSSSPAPKAEVLQGSAGTAPAEVSNSTEGVPAGWKALWSIPMDLGIVFMGLCGYWLYSSYGRSGLGVGFWFALFFLAISTAILVFGWRLIAGRWLVLNVSETKDQKTNRVKIWVPLPIHFVDWALRTFGQYLPEKMKERNYLNVLRDLDQSIPNGEPFQVDIDENGYHGTTSVEINL